jgi:Raf kinase inhibitor-like YbhB/YbcL family protein
MSRMIVCLLVSLFVSAIPARAAMTLTSSDIEAGTPIPPPQIYPRCGGENVSPQLSWSGAPAGTMSFVLTMIDISVKPSQWSHWIVVNLPPDVTSLVRGTKTLPNGAKAIPSNFGDASYDGPCPPVGSGLHQYQITIWALATPTFALAADMKAADLGGSLAKIALDHATLTGLVRR